MDAEDLLRKEQVRWERCLPFLRVIVVIVSELCTSLLLLFSTLVITNEKEQRQGTTSEV